MVFVEWGMPPDCGEDRAAVYAELERVLQEEWNPWDEGNTQPEFLIDDDGEDDGS